tara:strand:+ start:64 stop:351 length:288 start_codon:yes stop_codon:yes gene_type:complete
MSDTTFTYDGDQVELLINPRGRNMSDPRKRRYHLIEQEYEDLFDSSDDLNELKLLAEDICRESTPGLCMQLIDTQEAERLHHYEVTITVDGIITS